MLFFMVVEQVELGQLETSSRSQKQVQLPQLNLLYRKYELDNLEPPHILFFTKLLALLMINVNHLNLTFKF